MGSTVEIGSHADPLTESMMIDDAEISAIRQLILREEQLIEGLSTANRHLLRKLSSKSSANGLTRPMLTESLEALTHRAGEIRELFSSEGGRMGPSIDNHSPTADSSFQNSCDKPDTSECDAKIDKNTMPSAFDTRRPPPSLPTANLPMAYITNNGGTININYSFHTADVPRLDKGKAPAVKGEGTFGAERDPDLTSPLSPNAESSNAEPSSANSSSEGHITPEETVARHTEHLPHKKSHEVSAISDNEKAEVKHSIDLILLGSISRKDLSDALMNMAEALQLINDDEEQCADVPMQLGTNPSSADPDRAWSKGRISPSPVFESIHKIDSALEERGSVQAPVKSTTISHTNETLQHDCSELRIKAPPACQRVPSSPQSVDADGGNKSGATSIEPVVFPKNGSSQVAKLGPEPDDVPAHTVVAPAASPKKSKKKIRRAPIHRSRQGERGSKEAPREEKVPADQGESTLDHRPQDSSARPQGSPSKDADEQADQNEGTRKLELKDSGLVSSGLMSKYNAAGPSQSSSWEPAKLTHRDAAAATTTTTEDISARPIKTGQRPPGAPPLLLLAKTEASAGEVSPRNNNDMGQKLQKRRSKKPAAIEAGQCEGDITESAASTSASDPAARRAMIVDMLARMAGGPTSAAGGANQGSNGGHRDFTFLLPPPAESRKCRLCRNMFTDKSNVKQADGGAPCSFHPGVLEDKTGNNTTYAFSCCGGPPIMVGPNLVAMNLVSPGCTKCYHQDKRSAWNLETFTMKDPVLFEK